MSLLVSSPSRGYHLNNDDVPTTTAYGTVVTASGTANTKGSWVAIHSTINHDLFFHRVTFIDMAVSTGSNQGLVDLGIGPDSSNVSVICENLLAGNAGTFQGGQLGGPRVYLLPLYVPAGTQLWARSQASTASDTTDVAIISYGGSSFGWPIVTYIESIGEALGSSTGVAITPGNTGAEGAYTEIVASTANEYLGLMASWTSTDTTLTADNAVTLALGLGAATEEDLGVVNHGATGAQESIQHIAWPVFQNIPTGTRIAAKMSSVTTANSTNSAIVYGLMGVNA